MSVAYLAAQHPERVAILSESDRRTYAELNARVNRVARSLRDAGLQRGDGVALVSPNRIEFAEVFFATQRCGLRLTPVSWHLTAEEIAYVVADSRARALVIDAKLADTAAAAGAAPDLALKLAIGGSVPDFEDFEAALAARSGADIDDASLGDLMLYTSGTTGRPKGVRRELPDPERAVLGYKMLVGAFDFRPGERDITLATGPLYHSGPINLCLSIPVNNGIPTFLMEKWEAEKMLRLLQEHSVTHTFCVPTMFRRLLSLPAATREAYDVSALRFIIHGAAPTPVDDKRAIIEWFGPIVTEIYAATEGMGSLVGSAEWLAHPGTVGRPNPDNIRILAEDGSAVPAGEIGTVYLLPAGGANFEYHGDSAKTSAAMRDGFFSVGDMGYVDDAGYLFLTGRSAELILSGGTNVYPAEIDEVILTHPHVADAAAVGVPDADWGEVVKAIIVPAAGHTADAALEAAILAHCRERLATIKQPRSIAFVDEIPRSEAGKVLRRRLRDRYQR
jgi:long-chain acyl-CoA synthetase